MCTGRDTLFKLVKGFNAYYYKPLALMYCKSKE